MDSVLCIDNLTKTFRTGSWWRRSLTVVSAVDDISFTLQQGEILGFLGSNGSGKTTTIQMLLGVMRPTSGKITYFGKDFSQNRSESLQKVTFASAYAKLLGRLTISENLTLFGQLYGLSPAQIKERSEDLLKYFGMWNLRDQCAGGLSAGQTTRVMLAKAFLPRPKIILLDEPTASLDFDIALEVRKFVVQQQREEGTSVLFTSHNLEEVAEICNRVLMLKSGKIIANDTPQNLARSIATARVSLLMVNDDLQKAAHHAQQQNLPYEIKGQLIEIAVDEHKIASLLNSFAQLSIEYTNISIEKPRLEDYFLHIIGGK